MNPSAGAWHTADILTNSTLKGCLELYYCYFHYYLSSDVLYCVIEPNEGDRELGITFHMWKVVTIVLLLESLHSDTNCPAIGD
jgi:hypothetical protein